MNCLAVNWITKCLYTGHIHWYQCEHSTWIGLNVRWWAHQQLHSTNDVLVSLVTILLLLLLLYLLLYVIRRLDQCTYCVLLTNTKLLHIPFLAFASVYFVTVKVDYDFSVRLVVIIHLLLFSLYLITCFYILLIYNSAEKNEYYFIIDVVYNWVQRVHTIL